MLGLAYSKQLLTSLEFVSSITETLPWGMEEVPSLTQGNAVEVLTCTIASMSSHAQAWRALACETCCSRGSSTAHYRHISQLLCARIEMCSLKLSVTMSW